MNKILISFFIIAFLCIAHIEREVIDLRKEIRLQKRIIYNLMELTFTPHPMLESLSDEEIVFLCENDTQTLKELHLAHEQRIKESIEDPLRSGFDLAGWSRIRQSLDESDEVLVLGGNRSGKTTGCAKVIMEAVTSNTEGHIVCFSQNQDTSVKVQQSAIWEMMPKEFRRKTKSIEGYINFSMQNGFTGNSFIFPDTRTRVDFKTYTQFSNNQTILEGFEFGFKNNPKKNIGAWLDEYLGDAALVDTLRFRLATRDSKMLIGFTPIYGYTPFVADYLRDAQTIKTREAELLNNKKLPIIQKSQKNDAFVVYLHSDENPFGGYNRIKKDLSSSSNDQILCRAYGYPVKSITSLLPKFSTNINVLSDVPNKYGMKFPDISDRRKYTIYQIVDPAGNRNFSAIWAAVDKQGSVYIKREFPDRNTYGEWAIFGDPKWKAGPATKKIGYDVQGYADLFREIEREENIIPFERIGDSRYFARENEDNIDLFTSFADHNMYFIPSSGKNERDGIIALDDWFDYNQDNPIDAANKPICFIHEDCGNLIDSLINYNSQGKNDEPLKDFFDLIRYFRMANDGIGPDFVSPEAESKILSRKGGY
tara:strand:+ start:90 stop:1868 length:1779 start_codon:yes stop_codon:yes gene_type:complete